MKMNERLKSLRKGKGAPVRVIAEYLGVAISTYAGYEADESAKNSREPSVDKIIKLANYYGVSTDYIMGFSDNRANHDKDYVLSMLKACNEPNEYVKLLAMETVERALLFA